MKTCPKCQAQLDDNTSFCTNCGYAFGAEQQQPQPQPQPVNADPFDHTAEFDSKDISDNKVIAMLVYLLGAAGIIIALLASHDSPYVKFHLRQALKFLVIETLTVLAITILCWTFIVPIAGGIFILVLEVIKIICFFQICSGKAKEPAIIKSFGFLR
jgi:uncharacterized membrane protein